MPPAARISDMHVCPMVTGLVPHVGGPIAIGCPTVMIGGMPAARVGDMVVCVGPPDTIAMGSTGVFIGGMPAARMGDMTVHAGSIAIGMPNVMIGEIGSGGGGGGSGGGAGSTTKQKKGRRRSRKAALKRKRQKALKQALRDQRNMLAKKLKELNRWNEDDQEKFEKWFGTTDEKARKRMIGRIKRMQKMNKSMKLSDFKKSSDTDPDLYAHVTTDEPPTIHLGKQFWKAPATGTDSKAGTLSHEMSHFDTIGKTNDHVYGVSDSKALAKKSPKKALNNADSFQYYCEEVE